MQKYIHSLVYVVIVIMILARMFLHPSQRTIKDLEGITRYLRTEYVCVFPDYSRPELHKECDQNQIPSPQLITCCSVWPVTARA